MKKIFSVFLIFSLILVTWSPIAPSSAQAENNQDIVYQDGEYELPVEIWEANADQKSSADNYIENMGKLIVENGNTIVRVTLKSSSFWQSLKVKSGNDFVEVDVVSDDNEANTRVVQFQVKNVEELLEAQAHIVVPGVYDKVHDIRFKFDPSEIPLVSEDDDQSDSEDGNGTDENQDNGTGDDENDGSNDSEGNDNNNGNEKDPEQPSIINLEEGSYTITLSALHETEDKPSGMAKYIDSVAKVKVKSGKALLTVTLTDHKTVTGFQVEGKQPITTYVDEEANTREETYELASLSTMMNAQVQYKVGNFSGDHSLRLAFDETSVQEIADDQNKAKTINLDEGNYTISLSALHETEDKPSGMAKYIDSVAKVKVKSGKALLTVTLTDHKTVTGFQVEGKQPIITYVDEEANTREETYELASLSTMMNARVQYKAETPYGVFEGDHALRLAFDETSVQQVADEQNKAKTINLKDGTYTISFSALQEKEDKESSMARYIDNAAKVIVKNGKTLVTVTLTDHKTVTGFQIAGKQPITTYVDAENNLREETYELDSLLTMMNARVQYKAETSYGVFEGDHALRLAFDETSVQKVADEHKAATFNLTEDYIYTISINALDESSEATAIVNKFFDLSVKAEVKDEKTYLTLKIKNQSDVKSVKVNGLSPSKTSLNEEANTREETFELDSLSTLITVEIEYVDSNETNGIAPFAKMMLASVFNVTSENTKTATIQFTLDETTLSAVPKNNDGGSNNPSTPGNNNGNSGNNGSGNSGNQPPSNVVIDPKNLQDGEYTIDFTVLKDNSNQKSVMDGFVQKPAYLKVQNGKKYIAMTITSSSYVLDFKVEQNGQMVRPKLLQVEEKNNKRTVEFAVDDLYQKLNAWVDVNVPGLYNDDYDVQILFDPDSIELLSVEKEYPSQDPDAEQKLRDIISNNKGQNNTDDSLTFNRNDGSDGKGSGDNSGMNPKTADKTKLFLYLGLLVASLIPLAVQLRKKLRASNG